MGGDTLWDGWLLMWCNTRRLGRNQEEAEMSVGKDRCSAHPDGS